ncbi:MAG: periplasmic binding protein/LacI transcriptional regulator [Firmicutes bacterium]|jgi:ribose transport system substrate-binding protein|nr:periplasmic binding protein/LacI transcriptional regulator [Bacillota bacterium]
MGVRKHRWIGGLLSVVCTTALIAGCSTGGSPSQTNNGSAGGKKQFVVGWSTDTIQQPWRAYLTESIKKEWSKYPDVKLVVVEAQGKTEKQISDIEDLINQKVDLIMASPKEEKALTQVVAKAYKGGIPVVLADRGVEGKEFTTRVVVENVQIGEMLADYVGKKLNGKGNIVVLEGVPGSTTSEESNQGFNRQIKQYPDIKILARQPADYRRDKGLQVMENFMQAYPKIDAVVSYADEQTMGALTAAKNAKREKQIIWASTNATMEFLKEIKDGNIVGASPLRSNTSALAVKLAYQILKGEGKNLPKVHYFPTLMVDETNVAKLYDASKYSPDPWDPVAAGYQIRTAD